MIHARASAKDVTGANGNCTPLRLLALAETVIVSVEGFPAVTEAGEKPHEAPAGRPEQANETEPENPSIAVTLIVLVPAPPLFTVNEAGLSMKEKSGVGRLIT